MNVLRTELWKSWNKMPHDDDTISCIPVSKAQLYGRIITEPTTTKWLSDLGEQAVWYGVRDIRNGHTIHVVSDRTVSVLHNEVAFLLRLMAWMTSRPITTYWWDQDWVRIIPPQEDPQREHVNGGWAIPGVPEVHVYRREEAQKVLLHELIHATEMDVPVESTRPVLYQLEKEFGIRLWPHLGEAFTELYAVFLWSIVRAKSEKETIVLWDNQKECSRQQAGIVWKRIHDSVKDEDTNVFAYYILKWVLMKHDDFVIVHPNASVQFWYTWWKSARTELELIAQKEKHTESRSMRLGMTCHW